MHIEISGNQSKFFVVNKRADIEMFCLNVSYDVVATLVESQGYITWCCVQFSVRSDILIVATSKSRNLHIAQSVYDIWHILARYSSVYVFYTLVASLQLFDVCIPCWV